MARLEADGSSPSKVVGSLTTPRAAALAGVVFAVLFIIVVLSVRAAMPESADGSVDWVESRRGGIRVAAMLMPFAGIAFLWFIAVVRDGLGFFEDRFFATVFLGSGLLFLATMFFATSVAAGLAATGTDTDDETMVFAMTVVLGTCKTFGTRMAAVFMISLATIWMKTGLMPKWLVVLTYATAAAQMIAGELSMWVTAAFPVWVIVVSGLLLTRAGFREPADRSTR
ncbi:hypothetical protein [Mycolicibacterium sediminis]|uniref:hypothetical protein n=1 Tax=Mycolicibacterium sediminis TaxID=1286180 RepID=UPI001FEB407E|nr:hypothetical protein [Mycolicibacterium sediminis]